MSFCASVVHSAAHLACSVETGVEGAVYEGFHWGWWEAANMALFRELRQRCTTQASLSAGPVSAQDAPPPMSASQGTTSAAPVVVAAAPAASQTALMVPAA